MVRCVRAPLFFGSKSQPTLHILTLALVGGVQCIAHAAGGIEGLHVVDVALVVLPVLDDPHLGGEQAGDHGGSPTGAHPGASSNVDGGRIRHFSLWKNTGASPSPWQQREGKTETERERERQRGSERKGCHGGRTAA